MAHRDEARQIARRAAQAISSIPQHLIDRYEQMGDVYDWDKIVDLLRCTDPERTEGKAGDSESLRSTPAAPMGR